MTSKLVVERIDEFFDIFKRTYIWKNMLLTREHSPWHREENVAEHTRMVLDWYRNNLSNHRNDRQIILTSISAIFHDAGKPKAEIEKETPERGKYKAYSHHELLSARIWTNYAVENFSIISKLFNLSLSDVSNIAFFIEHHLPFDIINPNKRLALKKSIVQRTGEFGHQAWKDFLTSDQHGRISDDSADKIKNFDIWMCEWNTL